MIRMIQSKSAGHAKAYFSDALSKSDYFINDQELNGYFQGKIAERLGIEGIVTKDAFYALCENRNPVDGGHLTQRTREDRTVGYDINFHCPKSVSILHALATDDHLLNAFQESVTETMKDIERDAKTRVRKGGKDQDRDTGELIWADFVHQTARPVEGNAPDPHLHCHCFTFNVTWDATEKEFKAAQFKEINRDMPYYQARFHKRLADRLENLGYNVRRTDKSFEIEGVPQKVIDHFSKRTDQIGRIAKEKGITDAKEKSELGARTRGKKQKGLTMAELKKEWKSQVQAVEPSKEEGCKTVRFGPKGIRLPSSAKEAVDYAVLDVFERVSVMSGRRILEKACRHSLGKPEVSVDAITAFFEQDKRIIQVKEKGRSLCTTVEVLKEEKEMVDLAKKGQGTMRPLYETAPPLSVTGQQANAISHVLTTGNRVSIIRGGAGTGKTSLMREAVEFIEKAGKKVTVVAPTAEASRGVLRSEGFASAETVAKLLSDQFMQKALKGQVLLVDEAGLLGTKDTRDLLALATKQDARLILVGDTRQHASVVRGDALRILNTVAGIKAAEVSKIYRQRNEAYKAAVKDLAKGDVKSGFEKLNDLGAIQTIDRLKPYELLMKDYMAAVKKGKSVLVVSPTHAQGDQVTHEIRANLRKAKKLGKKEVAAKRLINLNLTEAQKSDYRNFSEGHIVHFNQNAPGIKRGSVWRVHVVRDGSVMIKNADSEGKILPLERNKRFDVYREEEIGFSKGDKVRVTRGASDKDGKRLNNGQLLIVASVTKKGIVLQSAHGETTYTLDHSFGHYAHAYCITSYTSQGKTIDEVLIAQPAATFPATDAKQFYVSVSRARDAVRIYTDDKEALLEHASELGERQSALELTGQGKQQQKSVARNVRSQTNASKKAPNNNKQPKIRVGYDRA